MRRNIMFVLAYDGTDFHGWQIQPGLRTVQGVLEETARRILRHPVEIRGAGRTDAGVHAAGQAANFQSDSEIPVTRMRHALGSRLAKDISLLRGREVDARLVASRHPLSKLYRYRVYACSDRPVNELLQRYTHHFWHPLDLERMRAGARHFVGTQDFAAMASKGSERQSTTRTVIRCEVYRRYDEVRFDIEGTGFLYNQVRNMVGTLIEVGRGHWEPDQVKEILESRDRSQAGPTAPAKGLCLQWVRYPPALLLPASEQEPAAD
ncbi:MAG: tRNA pseudouridine(38-40) synthase TruA [Phycisphaerales bacterium]|nr:MAG: tRNA pseudouridine(38-40) synthase TruA [Phycisphaerales bacterium]